MNIKESRCSIVRAVTVVTLAGLVGACADQFAPAPVFNKGIAPMAAAPAPLPPPRQITVQRGQSLDGIAHANHVPAAAIIAANKLKPPYELKTGARLLIPTAGPPPVQQAMAPSASAGPPPPPQQAMGPSAGAAAVSPPIPLPPPQPVSLTPPPAAAPQTQAVTAPPPSPPQAAVTPLPPPPQTVTPSASAAKNNPDIIPLDGPPPKQVAAVPAPLTPPQPAPTPAPASQPSAAASSSGPPPVMPPRNAAAALPLPGEVSAQPATADTSSGRFPWPVRGRVLASYGNTAGGGHNDGINIAAPRGTPVRSIDAGTVAYAGNEVKGYGNLVLIRHENGWISAYAHLDDVTVKPGDRIAAGQPFAKVGDSGGVAEPQLHFELRRGKKPVDPREFLAPAPSAAGAAGNKAG
jgi:murein DD-endopeptidase MepM/ murein hydrolase activator NlpD